MDTIAEQNASMFHAFCAPLIGLPVSRVWQGYGSAIFLEIGRLHSTRKSGGQPGSPRGDYSFFIEWSWRIEGKRRIWCGSWSDGERWPRVFARLEKKLITSASLFGRLPEVDMKLSNGLHLLSMMTAQGDPSWGFIKHEDETSSSLRVIAGRLVLDSDIANRLS